MEGWSTERRVKLTFLESTPTGKVLLKHRRWTLYEIVLWIADQLEGAKKTRPVDTLLSMKTRKKD